MKFLGVSFGLFGFAFFFLLPKIKLWSTLFKAKGLKSLT